MHRAGCALNLRGNCVFILGDNAKSIIVALKLTHKFFWGGWISLFAICFHDSQDLHFGLSITRSIIHCAGISNQLSLLRIFFDRSNRPIRSSDLFEFLKSRAMKCCNQCKLALKIGVPSNWSLFWLFCSDNACRFFLEFDSLYKNSCTLKGAPYLKFKFDRCSLVGRRAWISFLN